MNIIYITYDINLKKFLSNRGIDNLLKAKHPKTDRLFWIYERNEILNKALDDWFN